MQSLGAYEARTKPAELLDRVERGETITITRRGVVVAVLAPPKAMRRTSRELVEETNRIREGIAARGVTFTAAEIKQSLHEGHKY